MSDLLNTNVEPIEPLVDLFLTQLRAGTKASIDEFLQQYPRVAGELAAILPAVVLLEQHAAICNLRLLESDKQAPSLPAHQEIDDFTIVREIGRGGMGVVYEAVQQSLGRHVALKVLSMPSPLDGKHLERFHFEARAAARLHHAHIVPVFGVGQSDKVHYYVMQFIQGKSLHDVLAALKQMRNTAAACNTESRNGDLTKLVRDASPSTENGRQAESKNGRREFHCNVARIGLQVAEALAYAHSESVLHRDIKPSNLLLDANGNIWVTDFGLAKAEGTEGLTETGDFVGTLRYMAPERLEGVLDRRSDLYSLGATLYELLTQQCLFDSNSHARLVDQILHDSPPPPSRVEKRFPRDLETIILKAIAKEPAARYRTAEEMAEDLRLFLADRPILSRRPSAAEKFVRWCRRNPVVATLAGTVAILLVAAIIILGWSNARIRSEAAAKDKAMESARHAVQDLLARVASVKLSDIPMSHPLRVDLLEDAVKAYEGLLALGDSDIAIREQMADVLHTVAGLKRELGRDGEAEDALKRSAALYASLADSDPHPPAIREALAMVTSDLAYTWKFDTHSADRKSFPVEDQFRNALEIFQEIERQWPGRREPETLCLRYLADASNRRGEKEPAERLWREAIAQGEAYLLQQPENIQVRNEICWACIEYYEAILSSLPNRANEAQQCLAKGVVHAKLMQRQNPQSNQASDVMAALHIRQALVCCRIGKADEAFVLFQRAIGEIHSLCESVPWNTDYWNSAQWFHAVSVRSLQNAKRDQDRDTVLHQIGKWLRLQTANQTDDPIRQRKLLDTRKAFGGLLRSIGREREADEFTKGV